MNPIEKSEVLAACAMHRLSEALESAIHPEAIDYMKTLIREELKLAAAEGMNHVVNES